MRKWIMGVLPDGKVAKIEFGEAHVSPWQSNAVAIGTTAAAVTAWSAKVAAARDKYQAQQEAQNAAKAATNDFNMAMRAMVDATSAIIKQIKTQAALTGDGVYSLAEIPAPATPAPRPAPGLPSNFAAALEGNGALTLKWKCPNPPRSGGTIYHVFRKAEGEADYTYIGGAGNKYFTDTTVPSGAAQLMYMIQGVRSTAVGPYGTFVVTIGTTPAGTMAAAVSEAPMKKAA
jgi:hypothetical protein